MWDTHSITDDNTICHWTWNRTKRTNGQIMSAIICHVEWLYIW
jgi:hypothetical protein